ncbi:glycosyltransferase [Herbiconiux sp. UC225_62]|uniref:glycosyltransferase n=1 Tax=Herbiconiux sp. UC225_62 TaxID=3350168 RepID=UPI0036D3E5B4
MIGYYIHHVGRGHLSRASAIAAELEPHEPVTALSSLPRPEDWSGEWVTLPRDDDDLPFGDEGADAGGRLHWTPVQAPGLRTRMAMVSEWIAAARPSVIVSDVSVEIALLARLHGVPVVSVALPGRRDDEAHRLGFAVSSTIVSAWPPDAHGMLSGLDVDAAAKHVAVGAISRFRHQPSALPRDRPAGPPRVLLLNGRAGGIDPAVLTRAREQTPGWEWRMAGGDAGPWLEDPWPLIRAADVVLTHAGQNAIAEVAAARKPAVVIAEPRPHEEQLHTAAVLTDVRWPALVIQDPLDTDWASTLTTALGYDGGSWAGWNDGSGAARAAAAIRATARSATAPAATATDGVVSTGAHR